MVGAKLSYVVLGGVLALLVSGVVLAIPFWWHYPRTSFTEVEADRARLMDGFESYSRVQEVTSRLSQRGIAWELKRQPGSGPGDRRPPRVIDTVIVPRYVHEGFSGELVLDFFNDRLMQVVFLPNDYVGYVRHLAATHQLKGLDATELRVGTYVRVRSGADPDGRRYVRWSDSRLDDEDLLWLKRYTHRPDASTLRVSLPGQRSSRG